MRKRWAPKGKLYTYFAAYLYVFVLQAAFSILINASSLTVSLSDQPKGTPLAITDWIGAIVFLVGFLTEAISDH